MQQVVLITGCSSGIGKALALEFNDNGFIVVATARKTEDLAELKEKGCFTEVLDVTSNEDQEKVIDTVLSEFGKIDILINNAGYGLMAPVVDLTEEKLHLQFKTNVYAPLSLIRKVVPSMRKNNFGIIINIGSVSGIVTTPFAGAYCASKAALHSFSDALRMELKPFGINVITVQPGAIKSNFGKTSTKKATSNFIEDSWYKQLEDFILKRANSSQVVATPAEVLSQKIVRIIKKKKYPANLFIGKKSKSLPLLKKILPTKMLDSILIKKFGLKSF